MSRTLSQIALLLPLLGLFSPPCADAAALTPTQRKQVEQLIRQLGDHSFETRQAASRELARMGLAIKDFLVKGTQSPNLEIRRRCQDLLPTILAADRAARLEAFIADKEGRADHDLPGWKRFRALAGHNAPARKLYLDMLKGTSGTFLRDVEEDPERAGAIIWDRVMELQQKMYGRAVRGGLVVGGGSYHREALKLPEIASVVLASADTKLRLPNASGIYTLGNLLYQPASRSALGSAGSPSPYRKLVLAWIGLQIQNDTYAQYILQMAGSLGLSEAANLAIEVLKAGKVKGRSLGYVIASAGKLGNKKLVPVFQRYLNDKTVVANPRWGKVAGETQVRDVALAMLVHLTGQSQNDYGFFYTKRYKGRRITSSAYKFNAYYLGFSNESERKAAFKKWETWAAKNLKK